MESEVLLGRCPRCGGAQILFDEDTGEEVCGSCGCVIVERIEEMKPEWMGTPEAGEDDDRMIGPPTSLARHDMGLSTQIGREDTDAYGRALQGEVRKGVFKMRRLDSRTDTHLQPAFIELKRLADALSLKGVIVERTAQIYRKIRRKGLTHGKSTAAFIAASVYAACREAGIPRTLKDMAAASGVRKKEIARCYRLLFRELELQMPVTDPTSYISKIASMAGASERTKRRAIELLKKVPVGMRDGKNAASVAAAALYLAGPKDKDAATKITQKKLAAASGLTEVTIRNAVARFEAWGRSASLSLNPALKRPFD